MSLFAGMAAGFGAEQGQHNQKMLDFINQKSQTMAQLYGHLADNSTDPSLQEEFVNRAKGWASANPMLDPKGYQQLIKGEKSGLHDIVDQNTQQKVSDYHTQKFGVATTGGSQPNQPVQAHPTQPSSAGGPPDSIGPIPGVPPVPPAPGFGASGAQPAPNTESIPGGGGGPLKQPTGGQLTGPQGNPMIRPMEGPQAGVMGPPPGSQGPAMPQTQPAQTQGPPTVQPAPTIATPQGQQPQQSLFDYAKSLVGPEPPPYSALGRETLDHQMWREAVQKRAEAIIPTSMLPKSMADAINSPYTSSNLASPYLSFMGREVQANSRMVGTGYKLDMRTGQSVPLSPDEYSLAANLKMQKDQMTTQLEQATIPLRQALTQVAMTRNAVIPQEVKIKLAELGLQVSRYKLSEEMTNARLFSVGPDGKPLPGSLMLDGTPVSPMLSSNVRPTGQTQNRAETAIPVMQQIEGLDKFAKTNPDLFGIVQGNFENWLASGKNMTNDPREGELRASIISLASLMVPLHGFRSQKAAEEFMGRLSQGMSPEGFISALHGFNAVGENIYQNGMPTIMGGQGQERPKLIYKPNSPDNKPPTNNNQQPKHLDPGTAKDYLQKAGGDRDKARALAKADGWSF